MINMIGFEALDWTLMGNTSMFETALPATPLDLDLFWP